MRFSGVLPILDGCVELIAIACLLVPKVEINAISCLTEGNKRIGV